MAVAVTPGGRVWLRAARPTDVAAMQAIEVDAGDRFRAIGMDAVADDPPPATELLLEHVSAGTAWVAIAGATDGVPLGYALASEVDGEGHLDQVSVRSDASGRGVGALLVEAALAWSRAAGHPAVTLTTYRDVRWNGPWYVRLGFVAIPEDALTPGLRGIRAWERERGLEPPARIAMRRPIGTTP